MAGAGVGGVVLLVLSLVFGVDLTGLAGGGGDGAPPVQTSEGDVVQESPEEKQLADFISFVLDDVQETWTKVLPTVGSPYRDAKLVLFRDIVQSACGTAQSATGPFYCPMDEKVYIDLGFYSDLERKLGAKGDFAQAYVLAHEIGHHVQHILGTEQRVRQMSGSRPEIANQLSVRLELQADCFAGVWAAATNQKGNLDQGDVEEGLGAAAAVGDDRIQRRQQGTVSPESFTHGTSEQRASWFRRGMTSGRPESCDTFAGGL
jgi:predicted metalloprotease